MCVACVLCLPVGADSLQHSSQSPSARINAVHPAQDEQWHSNHHLWYLCRQTKLAKSSSRCAASDDTICCCRFQCSWHCLCCHGCSCDQMWQSGPQSGLQTIPPPPQPTLSLVALQQTPPPLSSSQVGTSALRSSPTIGSPPVVSQLSLPHTEVLDRVSSSAGRLPSFNNDPRLSETVLNCWIPIPEAAKLHHYRRLAHHLVQYLVQANHWHLVHHPVHKLVHIVRGRICLCLHPHCCSHQVQCRRRAGVVIPMATARCAGLA